MEDKDKEDLYMTFLKEHITSNGFKVITSTKAPKDLVSEAENNHTDCNRWLPPKLHDQSDW